MRGNGVNELPEPTKMSMREGVGRGLMSWGSGTNQFQADAEPAPTITPMGPKDPLQPDAAPVRPAPGVSQDTMGLHAGIPPVGSGSRFWKPMPGYDTYDKEMEPRRRRPFSY